MPYIRKGWTVADRKILLTKISLKNENQSLYAFLITVKFSGLIEVSDKTMTLLQNYVLLF